MAEYIPPKKNTAFIFYTTLTSRSSRPQQQSNPTLAAGDVTVSSDGAAFANITTLPTVTPAAGKGVKISLSAAEMNADNILVVFSDAAGTEWDDLTILIQTSSVQIADLTPALVWAYASRTLTSFGTLVADIWSNATRTLTMTAAAVVALITSSSEIERKRGDSWSISLTLGSITGYTSLWFSVKSNLKSPDTDALVQIKKNASGTGDGLIYLNGAAGTAALGSITINDASTGSVTIALDETASADLAPIDGEWDIQVLNAGAINTIQQGVFRVTGDVTRATS